MQTPAFLIRHPHIRDIPKDVPKEFEINVRQNQQVHSQCEKKMNPGAETKYDWTGRFLSNPIDDSGQAQNGNNGQQIGEPDFVIGIELIPGRERTPARAFEVDPKILQPDKIFRPKPKNVPEGPFHMRSVQIEVQQWCQEEQETGKSVCQYEYQLLPAGENLFKMKHEDAAGRQ
jgi:hypothetical protein